MRTSLLIAVAAISSFGVVQAADDAAREVERLAGSWLGTAAEESGEKIQRARSLKLVFSGEEFVLTDGDTTVMKGTFTVDPAGKPKAIDLKVASGRYEGQAVKGVYELDGNVLKVCFALPGLARPRAVATTPGDGALVITFQRRKP